MTEKPVVYIVGPNLAFGGVTRYLKDFVQRAQNHKVVVFNTARPKKRKIRAGTGYKEAFNSGIVRSLTGLFVTLWNLSRFPFSLVKNKIELVHICGVSYFPFWENSWYIVISKLLGKPVTLHYLGAFDQYYESVGSIHQFFVRSVLKMPDGVFLLSDKVRLLIQNFVNPSKLRVLPSSVDTQWFSCPNRAVGDPSTGIKLLFIGGLDPFRKGIYDLLNSFSDIVEQFPSVSLVLTGGDSFAEVQSKWEDMGLAKNIDFLGWIDDSALPKLYSSCDVLVLPSYNEGLPYVIIEALSSGLPIVASDVGGIAEVVVDTVNGFIIQPGDTELLSSQLLKLITSSALRSRMSHENRRKAEKLFSVENVIASIEDIFQSLLNISR